MGGHAKHTKRTLQVKRAAKAEQSKGTHKAAQQFLQTPPRKQRENLATRRSTVRNMRNTRKAKPESGKR